MHFVYTSLPFKFNVLVPIWGHSGHRRLRRQFKVYAFPPTNTKDTKSEDVNTLGGGRDVFICSCYNLNLDHGDKVVANSKYIIFRYCNR